MQPSRQHCLYASLALAALFLLPPRAHADILTITSSPPGATVEINGKRVGPTPYKIEYPGGYFHKTHSVFGERLEHSMTLRVSKDGYLPKEVTITTGPFEWVGLTGHHHGSYFLLRSDRFNIRLEPVSTRGEFSDTTNGAGPLPDYRATNDDARSDTDAQETANNSRPANAPPSNSGAVAISSTPAGADIFIDGKFAGQTPSTIRLAAGTHRIEVKLQDKQPWTRDLEVTTESQLTLNAVLAASP